MHDVQFNLGHSTICGLSAGSEGKPLILALHGWLDNAASFIPLASWFRDYHLIAIDFAGHGHSSHRGKDAHYHQMDFVQDLHELITTQQWSDIILLGHSMGGIIGSLYAATFPENIKTFISIEAYGPVTKEAESSHTQVRESIESRLKVRASEARHPESFDSVVKARALAGKLSYENAEMLVSRNVYEVDGALRWRTDRGLRTVSSLRLTEEQAECFMRQVTCPTLVIKGTRGFTRMQEKLTERPGWFANMSVVECDGGHHVHMDNPQAVAQQIIRFLGNN